MLYFSVGRLINTNLKILYKIAGTKHTFLRSYFDRNKKDFPDKNKMLEDIIFLPHQFHTGNMSKSKLLKQSGYFKFNNEISNADVLNAINKQPQVVKDWLAWSEDKRTGKGWIFEKMQY